MKTSFVLVVVAAGGLVLAGCGDGDRANAVQTASATVAVDESPLPAGCEVTNGIVAKRDAEVHVVVDEWTVTTDADEVAAGNVEFDVKNEGSEPHDLVLMAGSEVIGRIEPFAGGMTCHGLFSLAAGTYTLACDVSREHRMERDFTVR